MSVGEICNRNVVFTYRSVVLSEAARLMRDRHVGSLIIVEDTSQGRLPIGMLTDRDITVAVVAQDQDARNIAVGDAMSANPITVREEDGVVDALQLMRRHGVRRIPVIKRDGTLAGIVTVDDLLAIVASELSELAGAIHSGQTREAGAKH